MPRYFFDVKDGRDFPDVEGSIYADLSAARIEAVRYSGEILKDMPDRFWDFEEWTMTVSDDNRIPLFQLRFMTISLITHPEVNLMAAD